MTTLKLYRTGDTAALPLVLLGPFPLDAHVWEAVVSRLTVSVITVDPPGFGASTVTDGPSLEAYARAVLAALDAAGVDRFVVAGNSMGGYAAMALAELSPDRLAGIGLMGTKSQADAPEAQATRIARAEKAEAGVPAVDLVGAMSQVMISETTREDSPAVATTLAQWLEAAPTTGIAWAQRAMASRPDRTETLSRLDIPAVVLWGTNDLTDLATQQPMADALGVEVTIIENRGHLLPIEAPDEVATALTELYHRSQG